MVLMACVECENEPKYKCPTCGQPYCSMICCKRHKEKPCQSPRIEQKEISQNGKPDYEFPTEDTVPFEKLKLLEYSEELRQCLENPHVREILEEIDRSTEPDILMKKYMLEPIFTEFVDACLSVVQSDKN